MPSPPPATAHTLKSYTLRRFTTKAQKLWDEDTDESIRFTLTGQLRKPDGTCIQAFLDTEENRCKAGARITPMRDYDSVIGISKDILIKCDLNVNMLPRYVETLATSIHISYPVARVSISEIQRRELPLTVYLQG